MHNFINTISALNGGTDILKKKNLIIVPELWKKQSMAHITQNAPPPPPQQPTSTQSLIPPSSEQYAAVCWENITDDHKEIISGPAALPQSSGYTAVEIMWMHRCLILCLLYIFWAAVTPIQLDFVMSDFNNSINLDLFSAELQRRCDLWHGVCLRLWISSPL